MVVRFSLYNLGFVTIPSIERKRAVSEKDGKRKQLYIDISEDWRKSLQETIEKEIASGMLGKDIKYSSGKSLLHLVHQFYY